MENKTGPKDVFLHLLSIIALYAGATGFITLIFDYVNIWLPDPVSDNYYSLIANYSSARWFIAILIVIFPVYVWSVWFLNKSYKAYPEKQRMRLRKWLIYFTLFAAAIIIIGDLVTLVYSFLQGELTLRFVLKILTVFAAAASVFGYYFWDIKRENAMPASDAFRYFKLANIIIVAAVVAAGFFIVGSPKEERARKFDDQRVQNLQFIQSEIVNHWVQKGQLPGDLDELNDSIRGITVPADPENKPPYVYTVKSAESFELCATFNLPSLDQTSRTTKTAPIPTAPYSPSYYGNDNWQHGAGYICFERHIDPSLYNIVKKN